PSGKPVGTAQRGDPFVAKPRPSRPRRWSSPSGKSKDRRSGRFGHRETPDSTFYQRRRVMNWDQVKGNWKQLKGKVKEKWGKLTDDDLTTIAGKRDQLAGKLQERYGYGKEQAERELDDFARTLHTP